MRNIKRVFWGSFVLLTTLWLIAEPRVFEANTFFAVRDWATQYTGVIAISAMSIAMMLSLRPRWPERWLNGLDKMYRLHKWLGIGALVVAIVHWLWTKGAKWAVGFGWVTRPPRGARPPIENPVEAYLLTWRGTAEGVGEWAFYIAVVLIAIALVRLIPYRWFRKTHRFVAPAYLVLVFHAVVLTRFGYWTTPLGVVLAILLAGGTWAALMSIFGRIGASRRVRGRIVALQYYPAVRSLEGEFELEEGWPGHKGGQFAFATSDRAEGAHPFTIASAWNPATRRITLVAKELGDYTGRLRETKSVGDEVTIEGPYGCFTFENGKPLQIWIGGGIGITPFIAGMKQIAMDRQAEGGNASPREVYLFHSTAEYDEAAIRKLEADAAASGIQMHVLVDARDGRLTGERIRAKVPGWRDASVWFCGPVGFARALRADLAAAGFPVDEHFHQELFDMR